MDADRPVAGSPGRKLTAQPKPAVILTSYMSGAPDGRNLATRGYSYDFVVRAFGPLLRRWAEVIEVRRPETRLEAEIQRARQHNFHPIHVSFRALQHVCLSRSACNVVVPAWEFPDVPDHEFDNDARNNWVQVANRCSLVLVGGPFTQRVLSEAGIRSPMRVVPVPNPPEYFGVPAWNGDRRTVLECRACVLPQADSGVSATVRYGPLSSIDELPPASLASISGRLKSRAKGAVWEAYKRCIRPCLPMRLDHTLSAAARAAHTAWRIPYPTYVKSPRVELSGVVYTSIFAPADPRKNWKDLITAFLTALGDREDATLVLKLITEDPVARNSVLAYYRQLNRPHRCKVVVIAGFLPEEQMCALAAATTYYVNPTRAEGNCLPLMNYLAAGRPGISPVHTAIGDYFNDDLGYIVESHPEPASWPQDRQHRWRTTWHRLVWPSLVEQIRESYRVVKQDRAAYEARAERARNRMEQWASMETVWPRLLSALEAVAPAEIHATVEDQRRREKVA